MHSCMLVHYLFTSIPSRRAPTGPLVFAVFFAGFQPLMVILVPLIRAHRVTSCIRKISTCPTQLRKKILLTILMLVDMHLTHSRNKSNSTLPQFAHMYRTSLRTVFLPNPIILDTPYRWGLETSTTSVFQAGASNTCLCVVAQSSFQNLRLTWL